MVQYGILYKYCTYEYVYPLMDTVRYGNVVEFSFYCFFVRFLFTQYSYRIDLFHNKPYHTIPGL